MLAEKQDRVIDTDCGCASCEGAELDFKQLLETAQIKVARGKCQGCGEPIGAIGLSGNNVLSDQYCRKCFEGSAIFKAAFRQLAVMVIPSIIEWYNYWPDLMVPEGFETKSLEDALKDILDNLGSEIPDVLDALIRGREIRFM